SLALIRGVTGPIAAESVFALGFPFVVFGLLGMCEESAEAKEALDKLSDQNQTLIQGLQKVKALNASSCPNPRAAKNDLEHLKKQIQQHLKAMPANRAEHCVTHCIDTLAQLKNLNEEYKQVLLNRMAAPFGQAAMTGMTLGMLPGLTWGAAEIATRAMSHTTPALVSEVGSSALPAQVAAAAGTGVSMAFAPANAMMAVYAGLKAGAGFQRAKQLNRLAQCFKEQVSNRATPGQVKLVGQYIQAEQRTNRATQSTYGLITAFSQTSLSASGSLSIAAFFGAAGASMGATAGIAVPVMGALGAIGAAAMRIRGEMAAEIRRGTPTTDAQPLNQLRQEQPHRQRTGGSKIQQSLDSMTQAHESLAKNKLLSLAMRAIKQERQPHLRAALMDKWVFEMGGKRGKFWGQGTSLLSETVNTMRALYCRPEVQRRLSDAFNQTSRGSAVAGLMTMLDMENEQDLAANLENHQLASTVFHKLHRKIKQSPNAPWEVKGSLKVQEAQQETYRLLHKAFHGHSEPAERVRAFKTASRRGLSPWPLVNRRATSQFQEVNRDLTFKARFSDPSLLERIMACTNSNAFDKEVSRLGFHPAIEPQSQLRGMLGQHSTPVWLKNKVKEIAIPKLIGNRKNSSKVALHQAF
ncbi:MAG: hypothetical protein R3194_10025, partial [Limnobacter sp.]|nr:hypothetical protein [Limnobacter sp.]